MQARELTVPGSWAFTPQQWPDARGTFLEWFKTDVVAEAVGHPFVVKQANHSVSGRDSLRGVHFATVPPGQAKYVYCTRGAVLDVVVDLRVGSPTFGVHDTVLLDEVDRRAIYLPEGMGHAFLALADDTSVSYLCSEPYAPASEHAVHPLDRELDLPWPAGVTPQLSPKDEAAPSLAEALAQGLLPSYDACTAFYAELCGSALSGSVPVSLVGGQGQ